MKKVRIFRILLFLFLFSPSVVFSQQTVTYKVFPGKPNGKISPHLWGLFFEDINRSGDGGVYAELVKNRSFDFPESFMGWQTHPARWMYARNDVFQVINQITLVPDNPKYLQVSSNKQEPIWIANEGFGGITLENNKQYELTLVYRKRTHGLKLTGQLVNTAGKGISQVTIPTDTASNWTTTSVILTPSDTALTGKLLLWFEGTGQIDIDRISLFPVDTWKKRRGGLRADLVEKLADIQPGFLRFPGGCIVEGKTIDSRYQWKKTIGPLEGRQLLANKWQEGAAGKPLPDYFQTFGLGFMEYFQLCEDLKAAPLPIINCGISCQFDAGEVVPMQQMDPYIQDALDLIEFANGDVNTLWGARRAALGHFQPFGLDMIGIGNENWGPQYVERLQTFTKAIKAKYSTIRIITSTGYSPNPQFGYMDSVLRKLEVDIIDEHYYETAAWFFKNAGKYDHYNRKGPAIFLGEYACHSIGIGNAGNKNTLYCALAEAAFMTGLERNADVITMAAYAPLFAHVKDWQWTPNLIWFDNKSSFATPSYYVQQLFATNRGTDAIPIFQNGQAITGQDSCYASAVTDVTTKEVIIKIVNASIHIRKRKIELEGSIPKNAKLYHTLLQSQSPTDTNSIEHPALVVPVSRQLPNNGKTITLECAPYSVNIIKIRPNSKHQRHLPVN